MKMTTGGKPRKQMTKDEQIANLKELGSILAQENTKLREQVKNLTIPVVSISLPSEEEIREPIQNAIYATGSYTTDQCTEFADGILTYLTEAGYKVVRQ